MDINDLIKKPVQKGGKVFVYNGNGDLIKTYSTLALGKAYFSMSNDCFYSIYGFNFVPSGYYWAICKKAAGRM